jgi:hypothetical protein
MALSKNVKLMELRDVKIAKLLTDSATDPTYGTPVDIPGAIKVQVSPKTESKKLNGDSQLLDIYQKTTEIELDVEFAILNLDALVVLMGGSVETTGTDITEVLTYALTVDDATPPYFKIEGQWTYAGDAADAHMILYKCKVTDAPALEVNDASGNFGTTKFKAIALPCTSNGDWYKLVLNATKTDIA